MKIIVSTVFEQSQGTHDPKFPILQSSDTDPLVKHLTDAVVSLTGYRSSTRRKQSLTTAKIEHFITDLDRTKVKFCLSIELLLLMNIKKMTL